MPSFQSWELPNTYPATPMIGDQSDTDQPETSVFTGEKKKLCDEKQLFP